MLIGKDNFLEKHRFCVYFLDETLGGIRMSKSGTVKELFALLMEKKLWWMIPMVSVFLLLGLLIVLTHGSALSPFIYALF